MFLIEFFVMPLRRGRPRAQQEQVESSAEASYETELLECLAQILGRCSFSGLSVEQARRLEATSFGGFTNPSEALSWLADIEKILDEGMQCLDEDKVRIIGVLLEDDTHKWWVQEPTMRRHIWEQFKYVFNLKFCPPPYRQTKWREFERLVQGGMSVRDCGWKFWKLPEFALYMIPDKAAKTQRFLNSLNKEITLCISRVAYSTY